MGADPPQQKSAALMKGDFWKRGGGWVLTQFLLMSATLGVAPLWPDGWEGLWSRVAAGILSLAGAAFGISGAVVLGGSRTIFPEPLPRARLVRRGVYGIVRHPLYTSVILLSFAWALWWRSVPGLGFAAATLVFLDAKARHEEELLQARFLDYARYARRVRRLVPWVY